MKIGRKSHNTKSGKINTLVVTVGAVVLTSVITSFFVVASDSVLNRGDSLGGTVLGGLKNSSVDQCPEEMVFVQTSTGGFCVDQFEVSPSIKCLYAFPENQEQTLLNIENTNCTIESKKGALPWVNIQQHEAERLCRSVGKRLPSNKEWYLASLGTPDSRESVVRQTCNTDSKNITKSGEYGNCVSDGGSYDMIGNVWEWTNEMVTNGLYKSRNVPDDGYVRGVDENGVALYSDQTNRDQSFNGDYVTSETIGVMGMLRGGFYQSGSDAGSYAINMAVPPIFSGEAVGFRCVQ